MADLDREAQEYDDLLDEQKAARRNLLAMLGKLGADKEVVARVEQDFEQGLVLDPIRVADDLLKLENQLQVQYEPHTSRNMDGPLVVQNNVSQSREFFLKLRLLREAEETSELQREVKEQALRDREFLRKERQDFQQQQAERTREFNKSLDAWWDNVRVTDPVLDSSASDSLESTTDKQKITLSQTQQQEAQQIQDNLNTYLASILGDDQTLDSTYDVQKRINLDKSGAPVLVVTIVPREALENSEGLEADIDRQQIPNDKRLDLYFQLPQQGYTYEPGAYSEEEAALAERRDTELDLERSAEQENDSRARVWLSGGLLAQLSGISAFLGNHYELVEEAPEWAQDLEDVDADLVGEAHPSPEIEPTASSENSAYPTPENKSEALPDENSTVTNTDAVQTLAGEHEAVPTLAGESSPEPASTYQDPSSLARKTGDTVFDVPAGGATEMANTATPEPTPFGFGELAGHRAPEKPAENEADTGPTPFKTSPNPHPTGE